MNFQQRRYVLLNLRSLYFHRFEIAISLTFLTLPNQDLKRLIVIIQKRKHLKIKCNVSLLILNLQLLLWSLTSCCTLDGFAVSLFLSSFSFSLRFCSFSRLPFVLSVAVVVVVTVDAVAVAEASSPGFFSPSFAVLGWDGFLSASALALVCCISAIRKYQSEI